VYAFPKIIGRNNTGDLTFPRSLVRNEASDRTAVTVYTYDTMLC